MPILGTHEQEIDRTYTPLEARRREEMRLRSPRNYGFRVRTEVVVFPKCCLCKKTLYGQALVINGKWQCYNNCGV